jgi:hypothetical protein
MKPAVIIPIYKDELTDLERLSLSRCVSILGQYPIVFFGPRSLSPTTALRIAPKATKRDFDDAYFSSVECYSKLLLSPPFYRAFSDFDYILVHQLDAFVFHDALAYWCSRSYDYLGAPFRNEADSAWLGVGNGGFSLRNVRSSLGVLTSITKEDPNAYWHMERLVTASRAKLALKSYRKWGKQLGFREDVRQFLARFTAEGRPEDLFWSLHAARFHPSFRVAPVDVALDFAIEGGLLEVQTRYASRPPFGCHQNRFLRMISRFQAGLEQPAGDYEATVWGMAEKAGLSRQRLSDK